MARASASHASGLRARMTLFLLALAAVPSLPEQDVLSLKPKDIQSLGFLARVRLAFRGYLQLLGRIKLVAMGLLTPQQLRRDTHAFLNLFAIMGAVFAVIGAAVGLIAIVSILPTFITAGANASKLVGSSDFGNASANSVRPAFALLISIGVLFVAVAMIFGYFAIGSNNSS